MRFVFRLFSIAYVAGIFLFADSSVISDLSPFNPYSLLHIPLYAILTLLLFFSFVPLKADVRHSTDSTHSTNLTHSTHSDNSTHLTHSTNSTNLTHSTYSTRFLIVGLVATMIGVADEIHQAYIPGRNASVVDVFLDMVGIALCLFIIWRLQLLNNLITQ